MSTAYKKRKKAIKLNKWDFTALRVRENIKGTRRYKGAEDNA